MSYKIKGNQIIKKSTGEVMATSKNPKQYIKVLKSVQDNWEPKGKKK